MYEHLLVKIELNASDYIFRRCNLRYNWELVINICSPFTFGSITAFFKCANILHITSNPRETSKRCNGSFKFSSTGRWKNLVICGAKVLPIFEHPYHKRKYALASFNIWSWNVSTSLFICSKRACGKGKYWSTSNTKIGI